jgi:flagellar hook-basal body complex protein FliE
LKVFNSNAFISASAAKDYSVAMNRTHEKHMLPPDSPYFGSGNKALALRDKIGAQGITTAGVFEDAMLQALDKVSGAHINVSSLQQEAIINPDSVDIHDITIAQAEAGMALETATRVLNRLVQGWKDLINTR